MQNCVLSFVEECGHRCSAVNVCKLMSYEMSLLSRMVSHGTKQENWRGRESRGRDGETKETTTS